MSYTVGDGMVALALALGVVGYVYVTHQSRRKRLEIIHQERLVAMEKDGVGEGFSGCARLNGKLFLCGWELGAPLGCRITSSWRVR